MVRTLTRYFRSIAVLVLVFAGVAHAQTWQPDTAGFSQSISSIAVAANGYIFAGAQDIHPFPAAAGVYRSTDGGATWTETPQAPSEFPLGPVYGINPKGTNPNGDIFVGGSYEYRSIDEGNSWQQIRITPKANYDPSVNAFATLSTGTNRERLFVATGTTGEQVSDDDGNSWSEIPDGGTDHVEYVASTLWGSIFQVRESGEIDTANGSNGSFWYAHSSAPSLGSGPGLAFASSDNGILVAAGSNGVFLTTNNFDSYTNITPSSAKSPYVIAVGSNGDIFVAPNGGGIMVSHDNGGNWTDISSGLPADSVTALAIDNKRGILYTGTNHGMFQYLSSTGGVSEPSTSLALTLDQNSPNPVTSTTRIRFTVPEAGPVSLRLFDAAGREVSTVTDGFRAPGSYDVALDTRMLQNGAYYYRLESGSGSLSRMLAIQR